MSLAVLLDVSLSIELLPQGAGWLVSAESVEPTARELIPPLTNADLANVTDLPRDARTWEAFLLSLTPGGSFTPGAATLRTVGQIVRDRLLGAPKIAAHLAGAAARAEVERRRLRVLLEVDETDPVLAHLPVELAHDGVRFFFKQPGRASFRCAPYSEARNLRLQPGARVLIATAHADDPPEPDHETLRDHADAVAHAVRAVGFVPFILQDASAATLRAALLDGAPVDVLYVACHGTNAPDVAGRLCLRGPSLAGIELARWLEEATERGRAVQGVVLCSCSSAVPQSEHGTMGMAQWLMYPKRAVAALGFRGPVKVTWALRFTERLFERMGAGDSLEDAFAEARAREKDDESQWALAVLYGRRRDPDTSASPPWMSRPACPPDNSLPPLHSHLPRPSRSYFTGRARELGTLRTWLHSPGAALITSLHGEGGVGKSELAAKLAHEAAADGRPVIWLERADRALASAVTTLIAARDPTYQAPPAAREEDLVAAMRSALGAYAGVIVLDDLQDRRAVDVLTPGGRWNVLVTTRVRALVPGVLGLDLGPLDPPEALLLLSRVAWGASQPPAGEQAGAKRLVAELRGLPLALELAGATLRNFVTTEDYLTSLGNRQGVAVSDREQIVKVLTRSLADLDDGVERLFLALGVLPAAGATPTMVAHTLSAPEPAVTRTLDRLVRWHLVAWSPETGRYGLHPLLWDEARARARQRDEVWAALHGGAAAALEALAGWVHAPIVDGHVDRARERWHATREVFNSLDAGPWNQGAPGSERVATALVLVDQHRVDQTLAEREALLTDAELLAHGDAGSCRANVLAARGSVRLYQDDLDGAATDIEEALRLYALMRNPLGEANVLRARGDLRRRRDDSGGASEDYDAALGLYRLVEDRFGRLGQANTLKARGDLRRFLPELTEASADYDEALRLYRLVEDRLGEANTLKARGDLRAFRDDFDGAAVDYEDAYRRFELIGDRLGQASALEARGDLRGAADDLPGAEAQYGKALVLAQAAEDRLGQGRVLCKRADLRRRHDDLDRASDDYEAALDLCRQIEDRLGQANVLTGRGLLRFLRSDLDSAAADIEEALRLYRLMKNHLGEANALKARGYVRLRRDDLPGASVDYDDALGLYEFAEDRLGQAQALKARGDVAFISNDLPTARERYELALPLSRAAEGAFSTSQLLVQLSVVYALEGDTQKARDAAEEARELAVRSKNQSALASANETLSRLAAAARKEEN